MISQAYSYVGTFKVSVSMSEKEGFQRLTPNLSILITYAATNVNKSRGQPIVSSQ